MGGLFDLLTAPSFATALAAVTIVLAIVVAIPKGKGKRGKGKAISPLILMLPAAGALLLSPVLSFLPGGDFLFDRLMTSGAPNIIWFGLQLCFVAIQLGMSVWLLYRHRAALWIVLPFTLVLGVWALVVLATDVALIIGPLVKS